MGRGQHSLVEEMLEEAISAREKIARLAIGLKTLKLIVSSTKPTIEGTRLANKLKGE